MTTSPYRSKDVRDLQALASAQAHRPVRPVPGTRWSRAALLDIIDKLSRWSAAGLAITAGAAIFFAMRIGQLYPARAAAWIALVMGALWICRRYQAEFRSGRQSTAKPFRWRANYVACASVLGVAFASAPILLIPVGASEFIALQTNIFLLLAAFGVALCHGAYLPAALAFMVPATAFTLLNTLRASDVASLGVFAILSSIALIGLLLFNRRIVRQVQRNNPRTKTLRQRPDAPQQSNVHTTADAKAM